MTAYDDAVMADTPFLYWPLATNANDVSGNGRHGTVTGSWTFGVASGMGILGNGSQPAAASSYIRSGSIAFPTGKFAIEIWADTPNINAMLWGFGIFLDCWLNGGVHLNNGSANPASIVPLAQRHQVVCEFTPGSSTMLIYVDGSLRPMTGSFTPGTLGTTQIQVSGLANQTGYELPSGHYVSHFSMYQGGLTAARVKAHYDAVFPPTSNGSLTDIPSLEMWIEGDSYNDKSGKGRHGTPIGSPTIVPAVTPAGKSVHRFTNGTGFSIQPFLAGQAGAEIIAVFKLVADPPTVGDGGFWKWGGDGQTEHIPYTDGSLYDGFGSATRKGATVNPSQSMSASFVAYNVRAAAGAWSQHLDGTQIYTTATNTLGFAAAPRMGGGQGLYDLAFVAVFSEVLSAPNRALVMSYIESLRSPIVLANAFPGNVTAPVLALFPIAGALAATGSFTTEASEPLTLPVDKTGWASVTVLSSGSYQIDTIGSSFDTGLAVYTGSALGSLTLLASDNDSGGSSTSKIASLHLNGGDTIRIQVGSGTGTVSGNAKVNMSIVSLDGAAPPTPVISASQSAAGWLYKGRSSHAQDALAGG